MVKRGRIAIIPARGGSKRVPRKNVVDFGGRPMLVWTIEAAQRAEVFERVIVSTEDEEIAGIATAAGAEVPFLRESHHDDFTSISAVTISVIAQVRDRLGEEYDTVAQLMANCPLRGTEDIRAAVRAFDQAKCHFQISCSRFGWLNPWWAFKRDADGRGEWLHPDALRSRSQDLLPLYAPTGATWIARVESLEKAGTFYGPGHRFEPMPWERAIDVDDAEDLALARALFRAQS